MKHGEAGRASPGAPPRLAIYARYSLATFLVFLAFLYAPAFPGEPSLSTLEQEHLQRRMAEEQARKAEPDKVILGPVQSVPQSAKEREAVAREIRVNNCKRVLADPPRFSLAHCLATGEGASRLLWDRSFRPLGDRRTLQANECAHAEDWYLLRMKNWEKSAQHCEEVLRQDAEDRAKGK